MVVTFGEIMMRLAPPGFQRLLQARSLELTFGGGEANVAVSLAHLGLDTQFVTCLPLNDLGRAARMDLRKYGVGTDFIQWGGDRLGLYFLETGAINRASTVLYDRAGSAMAEVRAGSFDWERIFEGATWFHWTGITPAISEKAASMCLEAVQAAHRLGIPISTDLNFRKNLWKWGKTAGEVMPDLVQYCDLILANEEDAEKVFGIRPAHQDITSGHLEVAGYEDVCRQLQARFPKASRIAITLRGSLNANHNTWSGVLFDGKQLFQAPTYQLTHIVDRVGGGDSFMAGLIYGLVQGFDNQQALHFATAASSLKHTIHGDFNVVSVAEVETLMKGDGSGRVNR